VISDEDAKLLTLARGARLRAYAPYSEVVAGAAVRDVDGRTYAGATVQNSAAVLSTSALRVAVVAAAASGARAFEAAAVVSDGEPTEEDLAVLREFGRGIPVLVAGPDGVVRDRLST
jgi:cytidine deaminase